MGKCIPFILYIKCEVNLAEKLKYTLIDKILKMSCFMFFCPTILN